MKKEIKYRLFFFILGALIFGGMGTVFAYSLVASSIGFTPKDSNWNVDNVDKALNHLKDLSIKPELIWTNSNPTSGFAAQTINLDLSKYKYVIIVAKDSYKATPCSVGIVPIGNYQATGIGRTGGSTTIRHFIATTTGIQVSISKFGSSSDGANYVIPYKIYGVKANLEIDLYYSD